MKPSPAPVEARPAATAVLLRPAEGSLEVLLTQRPASMRFGGGMFVFPGGRLEGGESAESAAARETLEETGIAIAADELVPLTRWVTPYGFPVRFDTRFFGLIVPAGTDVAEPSEEIASWRWLRPTAALEGMAAGELAMWQPTVVTLQQLEGIGDRADLAAAFEAAPLASLAPARPPPGLERGRRFETRWAGGIEGGAGVATVFGRRRWLIVDPADPTTGTIDAVRAAADAEGATLAGALITGIDPARHAGVEMFARSLGLPVAGPPGADGLVPYAVTELADGATVPWTDQPLVVAVEPPTPGQDGPRRWADRAGRLRLSEPGEPGAGARPARGPSRRTSGGGR